ncbi:MAG: methylated-DNA--[protein]-cysteine S-methyltransferase [Syntrophobacterales bacterium]
MPKTVYYTHLTSPWGPLFLAGTEKGICSCQFLDGKDISSLISQLRQKPDHVVQENAQPLASAIDVLDQYFSGETKRLSHALDLQGTPFQLMVWSALRQIPPGKVATYGEIAGEIGKPRAARAVGQSCGSNKVVLFVPCHRVVAAQGKLGGFGSGLSLKKALLYHEGVSVKHEGWNQRRGRGDPERRRRGETDGK